MRGGGGGGGGLGGISDNIGGEICKMMKLYLTEKWSPKIIFRPT